MSLSSSGNQQPVTVHTAAAGERTHIRCVEVIMRAARLLGILIVLMLPVSLFGITLTVGNELTSPNASDGNIGATRTDIDLVHPATHSGSVSSAKLYWSSSGCSNAFKIKFFRRVGDTLTISTCFPLNGRAPPADRRWGSTRRPR